MPIELIVAMVCMSFSIGMGLLSPECPSGLVVVMVVAMFFVLVGAFDMVEVVKHVAD